MTDSLISREILHDLKDNRAVEEQLRDHYRDLFRLYQGIFIDVDTGTVTFNGGMINKISRITTNTTLDETYHIVFANTDSGAITVTLPAGVSGTQYRIVNTGTSGNDVTVTPDGAENLFGANSSDIVSDSEVIIINYEDTDGWY